MSRVEETRQGHVVTKLQQRHAERRHTAKHRALSKLAQQVNSGSLPEPDWKVRSRHMLGVSAGVNDWVRLSKQDREERIDAEMAAMDAEDGAI